MKSSPKTASRFNPCKGSKFCQCNNMCTECYDDEKTVPVVIQINKLHKDMSSNAKCLKKTFKQFQNITIRKIHSNSNSNFKFPLFHFYRESIV